MQLSSSHVRTILYFTETVTQTNLVHVGVGYWCSWTLGWHVVVSCKDFLQRTNHTVLIIVTLRHTYHQGFSLPNLPQHPVTI